MPVGRQGGGCVHHVAFRAADDAAQAEMVAVLKAQGLRPTEQVNRCCFRSAYFREPDGVLFEIATDDPGLHRRRAERGPGQRDQVAALVQVPPRRDRGGAATASLITGAAKRRCVGAAMEPQNSFLRAGRAAYSFSARTVTKQLCLRTGMRGKWSIHSRRLSPRILALTSPLTILPTQ